jgi:UDP-N-acetylmuramate--alanine ligase
MKIYISGISGTGMGPLALMAKNAGIEVMGSDLAAGAIYDELSANNIEVKIGPQDGEFLQAHIDEIDWFVHTSALPADHPELTLAREAGIKITKRDELTAYLIEKLGLKMVAVAGTHGKTTTTSMITFASLKLGLPVSYIVGTTLGFAPSGAYHPGDKFFIYEADEYDRNFLKFHPWLSVLPFVSYDHPDIYPTQEDYLAAFEQFKSQCEKVIEKLPTDSRLTLAGEARRADATLAMAAISAMAPEVDEAKIVEILNEFPGVGRRFERVADGAYTDYAHHPEEIAATIEMAKVEASLRGLKGVVVAYQPHQNTRQHEVWPGYKDAFVGADKLFWLPTYLTRENPDLEVLAPEKLIAGLSNAEIAEPAEADDALAEELKKYQASGYLVLMLTAGPADAWFRKIFNLL